MKFLLRIQPKVLANSVVSHVVHSWLIKVHCHKPKIFRDIHFTIEVKDSVIDDDEDDGDYDGDSNDYDDNSNDSINYASIVVYYKVVQIWPGLICM